MLKPTIENNIRDLLACPNCSGHNTNTRKDGSRRCRTCGFVVPSPVAKLSPIEEDAWTVRNFMFKTFGMDPGDSVFMAQGVISLFDTVPWGDRAIPEEVTDARVRLNDRIRAEW